MELSINHFKMLTIVIRSNKSEILIQKPDSTSFTNLAYPRSDKPTMIYVSKLA